jgi:hypothetical protein
MWAMTPNDTRGATDGMTGHTVREDGWPGRVAGEAQGI